MSPTPTIPMAPVANSSNVLETGYDSDAQTLAVRFKGGGLYHYRGVNAEVHRQLEAADSKGSFIAKHVKPHYPVERIVEATPGSAAAPAGWDKV